jgi:hypothetical protein
MDPDKHFIVVDTLFVNYDIVIDVQDKTTSVWCNSCEQWVGTYQGDALTTMSSTDFYEYIINEHSHQLDTAVSFGHRDIL